MESPNAFGGKLDADTVQGAARGRRVRLSEDQLAALEFINTTSKPVMVITAVAGTGNTTISGVLLDIYLRGMPEGEKL